MEEYILHLKFLKQQHNVSNNSFNSRCLHKKAIHSAENKNNKNRPLLKAKTKKNNRKL